MFLTAKALQHNLDAKQLEEKASYLTNESVCLTDHRCMTAHQGRRKAAVTVHGLLKKQLVFQCMQLKCATQSLEVFYLWQ